MTILAKKLINFGLSSHEAVVYITLLKLVEAPVFNPGKSQCITGRIGQKKAADIQNNSGFVGFDRYRQNYA